MTFELDIHRLSPEAKKVWESLTNRQRKTIQKENPFKRDRDALIYDLRSRGVLPHILAEITGISRQAIWQIVSNRGGIADNELSVIKQDVKQIQKAVGVLGHHISQVEKNNER